MGMELYFKVLGGTFLILGIFLLVTYLFKRGRIRASGSGSIQIKEVKPLGFKAQLVLIEVKDRIMLLGLSEKGLNLIWEWKRNEEV